MIKIGMKSAGGFAPYRMVQGFAHILVLILLLIGTGAGIVLVQKTWVQKPNVLSSEAAENTLPSIEEATLPLVSQGYIIEFTGEPISSVAAGAEAESKKEELGQIHDGFKKEILSRLGRSSFRTDGSADSGSITLLGEYFFALNGIALDISEAEAGKLESLSFIKRVQPNYEVRASLMDSVPFIGADKVRQLLRDSQGRIVNGAGTVIAVIDSGIDYTHPDLGSCGQPQFLGKKCGKVIDGFDFVNNDPDPMDDHSHGTHVAATAAGNGALKGVAPGAKLVAYKVLDYNGNGSFGNVIAAVDKAIATRYDSNLNNNVTIVNLSLGGYCGTYRADCGPDDAISRSLDRAAEAGIIPVVNAGNTGSAANAITTPGTSRQAITVGAVNKDWRVEDWSARGPVVWNGEDIKKPDVVAPGGICAALWSGAPFKGNCLDDKHTFKIGTSMAAPMAAGFTALVKQLYPNYSPAEIKEKIKSTARNIGQDYNAQGAGAIYAYNTFPIGTPPPSSAPTPAPSSAPTPAPAYNGLFETARCLNFKGWVCDTNRPTLKLNVSFYKDAPGVITNYLGTTRAKLVKDAAVAGACDGNSAHGFLFRTPLSVKTGQPVKIFASVGDYQLPSSANPMTITCSP